MALSMPCVIFLASHVCNLSLMSKLLPRPTPQDTLLHEEMCFRPGNDVIHTYKEEQVLLVYEMKRGIEIVGVQCLENGENMTLGSECGPQEEDATNGMEGRSNGVQEQPISGDNGVLTMIEEFKTPFDVTNVVLEESEDQAMEGDIEEEQLQRETKGLLEKIRDEGRTDMAQERGEYVEGICGGKNESDKKFGSAVEDMEMEVAWEDTHSGIIEGNEEDLGKEEDPNVCEEMLHSKNDESKDTMLEGKESDNTNDSLVEPMAEPSELQIPAEPIRDLPIEALVYNISVDEDSSEVISENIGIPRSLRRIVLLHCPMRSSSNVVRHTNSMQVLVSSVEEESRPSKCSSAENHVCPSQELLQVVLGEENIWKKMNVIRKIVGYEGRMQASCSDELKALYMFTGVEPPTCSLAEIKEKLHFLMSIPGIKSNDA
ncbi:hypothetical protein JHK87_028330 [Glycine soja]|nr:hypothetical protein JHK87_028330 [Glycine soja]